MSSIYFNNSWVADLKTDGSHTNVMRGNTGLGYFEWEGNTLKDWNRNTVGYVEGNKIKNASGSVIAVVMGYDVYDSDEKTILGTLGQNNPKHAAVALLL